MVVVTLNASAIYGCEETSARKQKPTTRALRSHIEETVGVAAKLAKDVRPPVLGHLNLGSVYSFGSDPRCMEGALASEGVERRLMAILAADVAGHSRLVGASEEGAPVRWKAYWRELIGPKITEHHGRIVRITGEGLLVEFVSTIAALRCAVEVQRAIGERNAAAAPEQRIAFRMGINVGSLPTVLTWGATASMWQHAWRR